jgi:hypothetical protein
MQMKSWSLALALAGSMAGLMATAAVAQAASQDGDLVPSGKGWGLQLPPNLQPPSLEKRGHKPPPPPPPPPANGIDYHNGPVMLGTTHIYLIWYGNWAGNDAPSILTDEVQNVSGTPWFNINTTYYSGSGKNLKHISNSVLYKGSTADNYSHGTSLSDSDIAGIVAGAITSGHLPKDASGIYFVLTSPDVAETSGFCTDYCGWHTSGRLSGVDIKYAFIGGVDRCPNVCSRLRFHSPNDNIGADGMASILAHELSETVTDPDLNAWYDKQGMEDADKCVFTFGTIYTAANGAGANVHWGPRDFLIQQLWVNANGGSCSLKYP